MPRKLNSSDIVSNSQVQSNQNDPETGLKRFSKNKSVEQYSQENVFEKQKAFYETPAYAPSDIETYSKYDSGMPGEYAQGIEEWRGQQQHWSDKWANATLKGVGLAATTFGETFADLALGIPTAIIEGRWSGIYDHAFSNQAQKFNNWLEAELPNYYTQEELENAWYQNLGTANFWADKFLKNMGFTAGAFAGAMVTGALGAEALGIAKGGRFFNAAAKLANAEKEASLLGKVSTSLADDVIKANSKLYKMDMLNKYASLAIAASTEAGIEAHEAKDTKLKTLIKNYRDTHLGADPDQATMQHFEELAGATGNTVWALNMPLLMISDGIQFGKALSRGYSKDALKMSKILTKEGGEEIGQATMKDLGEAFIGKTFTTEGLTTGQKALTWGKHLTKSGLREGIYEEMGQYAIERGAQDYWDRYYKRGNRVVAQDMIDAVGKGLAESYGTNEGWEQGFIGTITGMIGLPGIRYKTNEQGERKASGITMYGGIWSNPVAQINEDTQKAIDVLNQTDATFQPLLKNALSHFESNKRYEEGIKNGNHFLVENEKFNDFLSLIQTYSDLGMTDVLKDRIESVKHADPKEWEAVLGYDPGKIDAQKINEITSGLTKNVDRVEKIKNAIDIRYQGMQQIFKDNLIRAAAIVENSDERLKSVSNKLASITKGKISLIDNIEAKMIKAYQASAMAYTPEYSQKIRTMDMQKQLDQYNDLISKESLTAEQEIKLNQVARELGFNEDHVTNVRKKANKPYLNMAKYSTMLKDEVLNDINKSLNSWINESRPSLVEQEDAIELAKDSVKLLTQKEQQIDLFESLQTEKGQEDFMETMRKLIEAENRGEEIKVDEKGNPVTPEEEKPTEAPKSKEEKPEEAPKPKEDKKPKEKEQPKNTPTKEQNILSRAVILKNALGIERDEKDGLMRIAVGNEEYVEDGDNLTPYVLGIFELYKELEKNQIVDEVATREIVNKLLEVAVNNLQKMKINSIFDGFKGGPSVISQLNESFESGSTEQQQDPNEVEEVFDTGAQKEPELTPVKERSKTKKDYSEATAIYESFEDSDKEVVQPVSIEKFVSNLENGYMHPDFIAEYNRIKQIQDATQREKELDNLRIQYNTEIGKFNEWSLNREPITEEKPVRIEYIVTNQPKEADASDANIAFFPIDENGQPLFKYLLWERKQMKDLTDIQKNNLIGKRISIVNAIKSGKVFGKITYKGGGKLADGGKRINLAEAITVSDKVSIGIITSIGTIQENAIGNIMEYGKKDEPQITTNKDDAGKLVLMIEDASGAKFPLRVSSKKIDEKTAEFVFDLYHLAYKLPMGLKTIAQSNDPLVQSFMKQYGVKVGSNSITLGNLLNLIVRNGKHTLDSLRPLMGGRTKGGQFIIQYSKAPTIIDGRQAEELAQVKKEFVKAMQEDRFFNFDFKTGITDITTKRNEVIADIEIKELGISLEKGKPYASQIIRNGLIETRLPAKSMVKVYNSKTGQLEDRNRPLFYKPLFATANLSQLESSKEKVDSNISQSGNIIEQPKPVEQKGEKKQAPDRVSSKNAKKFMLVDEVKNETSFQEEKEKVNRILGDIVPVNEKQGLIDIVGDKKAMGVFHNDMITLSDVGTAGRGYHEAYHRVSMMLLTAEQRNAIYEEAKKKTSEDPEEYLAEKFREYALNQDARGIGQKVLDWFKRLWKLVKSWISKKPLDINQLFENIYYKKYKNKEALVENVSNKDLHLPMEVNLPFTSGQVSEIVKGLTYMAVQENNITDISNIKNINWDKLLDKIDADITTYNEDIEEYKNDYDVSLLEQRRDMFEVIKDNFPVFKQRILMELREYSINTDIEDLMDVEDIGTDQHYKSSEVNYNGKENAFGNIKFMIRTLPKDKYTGEVGENGESLTDRELYTFSGFVKPVDNQKIWAMLFKNLHDKRGYPEMIESLKQLAKKEPSLLSLINRLNESPEYIRTQFFNTLSKARHNYVNFLTSVKSIYEQKGKKLAFTGIDTDISIVNAEVHQDVNQSIQEARNKFRSKDLFGANKLPSKEKFIKLRETLAGFSAKLDEQINVIKTSNNTQLRKGASNKAVNIIADILLSFGVKVSKDSILNVIREQGGSTAQGRLELIKNKIDTYLISGKSSFINKVILSGKMDKAPIDDENLLRDFVREEAKKNNTESEMIKSGVKEAKYRNLPRTYLDDQTSDLNENFESVIDIIQTTNYGKNSIILKQLKEGAKLSLETFNIAGKEGDWKNNKPYTKFIGKDDYLMKLIALANNRVLLPTLSDASTYRMLSGIKLGNHNMVKTAMGLTFKTETIDTFFNYFMDEYNTIKAEQDKIFNKDGSVKEDILSEKSTIAITKNFHYKEEKDGSKNFKKGNAFKFRIFSQLDAILLNKETGLLMSYNEAVVKASITNMLFDLLKVELSKAVDMNVITRGKSVFDYKNVYLPKELIEAVEEDFKSESDQINSIIADGMIKNIISTIETSKLYFGDFAYYSGWQDVTKRISELRSPGETSRTDHDKPYFTMAVVNEIKTKNVSMLKELRPTYTSAFTKYLYDTNSKRKESEQLSTYEYLKLTEEEKAFVKSQLDPIFESMSKNTTADAAMYITPERAKQLYKQSYGDWNADKEKYFNEMMKETSDLTVISDPDFYSFIINPIKDVYYGMEMREGNMIPQFNKMAKFILWPSIYKEDSVLGKLRKMMEEKGIDEVGAPSVVKVGATNINNIFEVDANDNISINDKADIKITVLNSRYNRRQLVLPMHEGQMNIGTQIQRQIKSNIQLDGQYDFNGRIVTGEELMQIMDDVRIYKSNNGVKRLRERFGMDENGIIDEKKFVSELKKMLIAQKADMNVINNLTDTEGKMIPLDMFSSAKFGSEKAITGLIKKMNVKLSMPGRALIQIPSVGRDENLKLISDGKRTFAQAAVSVSMYSKVIPNYEEKTFAEKRAWLIKNKDLIQGVGYYMPTQGATSIIPIVAVDFVEENKGEVIYLPYEITTITGKDYDIDEIYLINYSYKINQNTGKVEKVKYMEPKKNESKEDFLRRLYEERVVPVNQIKEKKNVEKWMANPANLLEWMYILNGSSFDSVSDDEIAGMLIDSEFYEKADEIINKMLEIPSESEFIAANIDKSINEINSIAANNNRYLDAMMAIFKSDEHLLQNVTPLDHSTEYLKGIITEIDKVEGVTKKDLLPGEFGTLSYQVDKKTENMIGKTLGISISSLYSSFFPLAQQSRLVVNGNIGYGNKVDINGEVYTSLHDIYNEEGRYITEIVLGMQNGFVDIVKDPWVNGLNLNETTIWTALFLAQAGMGKHLFYVLRSSAIKELSKQSQKGIIDIEQSKKGKVNDVFEQYKNKLSKIANYYNDKLDSKIKLALKEGRPIGQLEGKKIDILALDDIPSSFLSIQEISNSFIDEKLEARVLRAVESGKQEKLSEILDLIEKYKAQMSILKEWKRIDNLAKGYNNSYSSIVFGTRTDNHRYGSTITEISRINKRTINSKQNTNFKTLVKNKEGKLEIASVSRMFDNTYLETLRKNGPVFTMNFFKTISIKGKESFNDFIDVVFNKYGILVNSQNNDKLADQIADITFASMLNEFILNKEEVSNAYIKGLLFGENNIAKQTSATKEAIDNELVKYLKAVDNTENKGNLPSYVFADISQLNKEIDKRNDLTKAWLELYLDENHKDYAVNLVYYAILSTGYQSAVNSITDLIPAQILIDLGLVDFLRNKMATMNDVASFMNYMPSIDRESWKISGLIPRLPSSKDDTYIIQNNGVQVIMSNNKDLVKGTINDEPRYAPMVYIIDKEGKAQLFELIGTVPSKYRNKPVYVRISKTGYQGKGFTFNEYGIKESIFEENNVKNPYAERFDRLELIRNFEIETNDGVLNPFANLIPLMSQYQSDVIEIVNQEESNDIIIESEEKAESVVVENKEDVPMLSREDMSTDGLSSNVIDLGYYWYNNQMIRVTQSQYGTYNELKDSGILQKWWKQATDNNIDFYKKWQDANDFFEHVGAYGIDAVGLPNGIDFQSIDQIRSAYIRKTEELTLNIFDKNVTKEEPALLSLFDKRQSVAQEQINKEIDDNKVCKL